MGELLFAGDGLLFAKRFKMQEPGLKINCGKEASAKPGDC